MLIKYFDEEKNFDFIKDYKELIKKCHKEFNMNEDEINSFKLYLKDEDDDELIIETEQDYKELIEYEDNDLILIIETNRKK